MQHSIDLPAMTLTADFEKNDGSEASNTDLASVALTAIVRAAGGIVKERYALSEEEILEMFVEVGKSAQESLDSKKG
jgi:hypothetical protein